MRSGEEDIRRGDPRRRAAAGCSALRAVPLGERLKLAAQLSLDPAIFMKWPGHRVILLLVSCAWRSAPMGQIHLPCSGSFPNDNCALAATRRIVGLDRCAGGSPSVGPDAAVAPGFGCVLPPQAV